MKTTNLHTEAKKKLRIESEVLQITESNSDLLKEKECSFKF
jgi:hypothetical protein